MVEDREPTAELRAGRRALEGMAGVALIEDWTWYDAVQRWGLRLRLAPDDLDSAARVPAFTNWYLLAHPDYPAGIVSLYPAKDGGLTETFPHQTHNSAGAAELPWRAGNACVATPDKPLGRLGQAAEPTDASGRLRWNVQRTLAWLRYASRNELLLPGDPFELPQFPIDPKSRDIVAFSEGKRTLQAWSVIPEDVGLVDFAAIKTVQSTLYAAVCFRSLAGNALVKPAWGQVISDSGPDVVRGAWIRLSKVPVIPPWQGPATWGELARAASLQQKHVADLLQPIVAHLRDGEPHILLVGAPIPAIVAGEPVEMHWQAIELPVLTRPGQKINGFRNNERSWWQRDRMINLGPAQVIGWLLSQNWHADRLRVRGGVDTDAGDRPIVLIGVGALGSIVAEMLVRAGFRQVTVVDGESLATGNLVRHTLTLEVVGASKAQAVAARLNRVSPHAEVRAVTSSFPPSDEQARAMIADCDIVVDCTGNDDLLEHLARFLWEGPKLFVSLSLGFEARRVFCYAARAKQFPVEDFNTQIQPWLRQQLSEGGEYPWEGPGCWNPVFPARFDDVAMMAAAGIRFLESCLANDSLESEFVVYERWGEGNLLGGIRIAAIPT